MKEYLQRLHMHMQWANLRTLESLKRADSDIGNPLYIFAHTLASDTVWLTRLQGEDSSAVEIWPAITIEECGEVIERNHSGLKRFVDERSEEEFAATVTCENSMRRKFQNSMVDILLHLSAHAAYHRGQIAMMLRDAGKEPVNTDYNIFRRE